MRTREVKYGRHEGRVLTVLENCAKGATGALLWVAGQGGRHTAANRDLNNLSRTFPADSNCPGSGTARRGEAYPVDIRVAPGGAKSSGGGLGDHHRRPAALPDCAGLHTALPARNPHGEPPANQPRIEGKPTTSIYYEQGWSKYVNSTTKR